jgi:hypothetical protein
MSRANVPHTVVEQQLTITLPHISESALPSVDVRNREASTAQGRSGLIPSWPHTKNGSQVPFLSNNVSATDDCKDALALAGKIDESSRHVLASNPPRFGAYGGKVAVVRLRPQRSPVLKSWKITFPDFVDGRQGRQTAAQSFRISSFC